MKINYAKCANPSCYLEHEVCGKEFKILTCLNVDEVKYCQWFSFVETKDKIQK